MYSDILFSWLAEALQGKGTAPDSPVCVVCCVLCVMCLCVVCYVLCVYVLVERLILLCS